MDSENVKNQEQNTADQTTGNSESYGRAAGNYQKEYRSVTGRRPRIHTQHSASASSQSEDGGFRPEGFGAGLGSQQQGGYQPRQQGYRPRYNQDGEQQQGGYQPRQQGYRPRYNQDGEQQQGGYQPRQQGGYQQRSGYGQRQQGGYQQRSGYGQQGGYQQRGGYGQQGGYQQRGGYNRGGYGQQGGYNQGGYQQRQRTPGYDPNAKYSMKKRIEYKEENYDPNEPLRLNKFLANAGICSRREADEFIQAGSDRARHQDQAHRRDKIPRPAREPRKEGVRAAQQTKGLRDNKRRPTAA